MNRKTLVTFTSILTLLVFAAVISAEIYWKSRAEDVAKLNTLKNELELGTVDVSSFDKNPITTLPARLSKISIIESELDKLPEYQEQKDGIIQTFDREVNEYTEKARTYAQVDTSFLPENLDSIPFNEKKDPDVYLNKLKQEFYNKLLAYNQASNSVLRWEINPEEEIKKMGIEEKIAQMFVFGIEGQSLTDSSREFLEKYKPGGIVYLGENISENLNLYSSQIQQTNHKYPLFITIDQEGGDVKRIWWDQVPGPKELASMSEEEACNNYKKRDDLIFSLGANWNLGIVADVTGNPASFIYSRVFGSDYSIVSQKVHTAIECAEKTLSTLKHYPGHGATDLDTHQTVAVIGLNKDDWYNKDGMPFIKNLNADSIMMGHLKLNWLDPHNPASLSQSNINYLRTDIGYKGLVVTDGMNMLTASGYTWKDALKLALIAGNDVLVYTNNDTSRQEVLKNAFALIKEGLITENGLNLRVKNILTAKNKIIKQGEYVPKELIYTNGHVE